MSQWRSSWLSREGLLSLITYVPTGLYAIGWVFLGRTDGVWAVLGMAGAFLCLLTIYCTSMIYVSLRTIHAWANPHVSPLYILLGLMTGALQTGRASGRERVCPYVSIWGVAVSLKQKKN